MSASTLIKLRVNNAEQFKESVSEVSPNTALYLTIGAPVPWANDASPDTSNTSVATEYEVWRNMIGGKKLTGADIRHVIPRYNWETGISYTAYDHMNPNLYVTNTKFYVLTTDKHIYKCIANNGSANSTVEPTSINPNSTTQTSDGYIWKYMYSLADQDLLRYTTDNYIPVKQLSNDDGSTQWDVQQAAVSGSIESVVLTSGGSLYSNTANVIVTITGDGTTAAATANINTTSGLVTSITVTDPGIDYSFASVEITGGGGSGATARAIISPPGGHGSNPLYELGGSTLILNPRIIRDEDNILPVTNDYRQIALIANPYLHETTTVASNSSFFQGYTIASTGSGDFSQDEWIYQGTSLLTSTFKAKVLQWDSANGIVLVTNSVGTPTTGTLVGSNTATSRFLTSADDGDFDKYSGQLLYVDNILPISRASDQTESFQIIIRF